MKYLFILILLFSQSAWASLPSTDELTRRLNADEVIGKAYMKKTEYAEHFAGGPEPDDIAKRLNAPIKVENANREAVRAAHKAAVEAVNNLYVHETSDNLIAAQKAVINFEFALTKSGAK